MTKKENAARPLRSLNDIRESFEVLDREFDDQNEADILREIACGAHLGDR